jgi:hypothetical protein
MILKLTTNEKKTEIWVNLQQVVQITTITVQDGYPSTELIMTNGAAVYVHEKPVDIARAGRPKSANPRRKPMAALVVHASKDGRVGERSTPAP